MYTQIKQSCKHTPSQAKFDKEVGKEAAKQTDNKKTEDRDDKERPSVKRTDRTDIPTWIHT